MCGMLGGRPWDRRNWGRRTSEAGSCQSTLASSLGQVNDGLVSLARASLQAPLQAPPHQSMVRLTPMKRLPRHDARRASILITSGHRSTCPPFPEVGNARTGSNGSAIHSDPADRHGRREHGRNLLDVQAPPHALAGWVGARPSGDGPNKTPCIHTYSAILPSIHRATGGLGTWSVCGIAKGSGWQTVGHFLGRMSKASSYRSFSSNHPAAPARQGGRTVEISGLATQQR